MNNLLKKISVLTIFCLILTGCTTDDLDQKAENPPSQETETEQKSDSKSKLESIKEKGELHVGVSADYPPYEFHYIVGGKDEIVGFDMDIAKEIADHLGVKLVLEEMDFDLIVAQVKTGKLDLGISALSPTPERAKEVNFSDMYYVDKQTILVKKDGVEQYTSEGDLSGKKIGVQLGSLQEKIAKQIEGAEVVSYPLTTSIILELQTGAIDAVVLANPVATQYAKQHPEFAVPEGEWFTEYEESSSIAITKGETDLLNEVNTVIKDLKDQGKIEEFWIKNVELSEKITD